MLLGKIDLKEIIESRTWADTAKNISSKVYEVDCDRCILIEEISNRE
jgi:hypothetical protein